MIPAGAPLRLRDDGIYEPTANARIDVAYPKDGANQTFDIEEHSFWFQHRNRVLGALLGRFPCEGDLWDIGGGNGFQAAHLEQQGVSVVLVEPGLAGCRHARQRGVSTVVMATLEALQLKHSAIAGISLLDVIEHLPNPDPLLAECHRVLVPRGLLYVTVPAYACLWSDEDIYAEHQRRYTRATLMSQLKIAGFEIEYVTHFFQCLLFPIFLLRVLPYRLMPHRKGHRGEAMDPSEHQAQGLTGRMVDFFLRRELRHIEAGFTLRFGSSLLAVVRRSS